MHAVIYHNPACGTSRNTLALIRHVGIEPQIIEYLRDPPTRATLQALIAEAGLSVRDALRQKGTPYLDLGLDDPALDDAALLSAMLAHPILINRPFVRTDRGVRLCRPSEQVLELLPAATSGFIKEDGERVLDEAGRRVSQ
ncbi:arsenate reductase (glutaredoxin) [Xanthomonas campestris pv. campestris]|uniref:arsenate reductase (glutaredoxin) n=1 Tax=Xanthomonas campestris TaxID=339 RepID=UPI0005AF321B|nr:arsenate reductase (glutaredoxin) [Xanthomonas campestris]KIQ25925.1 arsenate reductase [Xanthomonas campestris]MEA0736659.1 arsenate reductase (glutaredoxin) [Xanthomonas campestris pv. campestris]